MQVWISKKSDSPHNCLRPQKNRNLTLNRQCPGIGIDMSRFAADACRTIRDIDDIYVINEYMALHGAVAGDNGTSGVICRDSEGVS